MTGLTPIITRSNTLQVVHELAGRLRLRWQIGATVGMRAGRKINWRASVEQRHLVNRLQVPI